MILSELADAIGQLSTSQELLNEFARQMERHPMYSKPTYQEKINDLRDYSNGLSVVTYLVPPQKETPAGDFSIATILREQLGLIGNVLAAFDSEEGQQAATTAFDLKDADRRRITMSLQGMIELNNLLRQEEDVTLSLSESSAKATTPPVEAKKGGFFKKLFGGR